MDEYVKVPFKTEEDGTRTFFLPSNCRMGKGYEIGAHGKDKERGIQDYWEALAKISAMKQARFRRRNKIGIFGTVTCDTGDVAEGKRSYIEEECARHGG